MFQANLPATLYGTVFFFSQWRGSSRYRAMIPFSQCIQRRTDTPDDGNERMQIVSTYQSYVQNTHCVTLPRHRCFKLHCLSRSHWLQSLFTQLRARRVHCVFRSWQSHFTLRAKTLDGLWLGLRSRSKRERESQSPHL